MSEEDFKERVDPIITLTAAMKEYDSATHGRMTDLVAFQVPVNMDVLIPVMTTTGFSSEAPLPPNAIALELSKTLNESSPKEAQYEIYQANVGRGASGYGAVVEFVKWT